jgi:hypothetical protein
MVSLLLLARVILIMQAFLVPRRLDVLDYVSHTSDPEGGSQYPLWVPKWSDPRATQPMVEVLGSGFCDGHFRYFAGFTIILSWAVLGYLARCLLTASSSTESAVCPS